jgi:Rad3-related DNA helicase
VVVLDPRIVTTRYGRVFLAALPDGVKVRRIEPEYE